MRKSDNENGMQQESFITIKIKRGGPKLRDGDIVTNVIKTRSRYFGKRSGEPDNAENSEIMVHVNYNDDQAVAFSLSYMTCSR